MKATHGRKILNGDIANMSIGQGDILATPLQMAQAMGIIANGGTFYQTRLVQQVQTLDNEIVTAYQVRAKRNVDLSPHTMDQVRTGMIDVVNGGNGTAHQASLGNVEVAGKTGTAQWGPKPRNAPPRGSADFCLLINPIRVRGGLRGRRRQQSSRRISRCPDDRRCVQGSLQGQRHRSSRNGARGTTRSPSAEPVGKKTNRISSSRAHRLAPPLALGRL